MNNVVVNFKKIHDQAKIPTYATEGSSGMDLYALEDVTVQGKSFNNVIRTGITLELPEGTELQIRSRSGLTTKHGIRVAQGVGTVDSDYRAEILVIIDNIYDNSFLVHAGDRIAQGILSSYYRAQFHPAEQLSDTKRGSGGFGSTGT